MYYTLPRGSLFGIVVHTDPNATNASIIGTNRLGVSVVDGDVSVFEQASYVPCGVYPIRINIDTNSGSYSINRVIYVLEKYDVVEHVFSNQIVKGFLTDRTESGITLSVFICTPKANDFAVYTRYEYVDEFDMPFNVIDSISKTISNDPLEHTSYSVELFPTFPILSVFNDFKKQSFAFVRITNENGDIIADGILDINDGRFEYKSSQNFQKVKRKHNQTEEIVTYNVSSERILFRLYASSSILSVLPVVDNFQKEIFYNNSNVSLNGEGLLDFLSRPEILNLGPYNGLEKVYKLFEAFTKVIVISVLGDCGLYRTFGNTYFQGFRRLASAFPIVHANPYCTGLKYVDIIEMYVNIKKFITSDVYGTGTQANGDLRSYNVEPTRGLRGRDGRFPNKDKELPFSFLQHDTAQDALNSLCESTQYIPYFYVKKIQTLDFTHAYHYTIDAIYFRDMRDNELFTYDSNSSNFEVSGQNVFTIDKNSKNINQIIGGEISEQENVITSIQANKQNFSYSAKEINGAGNEFDGKTINDGFFDKIIFEEYNSNPILSISNRENKKDYTLIFSSIRRGINTISDNSLRNVPIETLTIDPIPFFVVNSAEKPRIENYYAEAFVQYVKTVDEYRGSYIDEVTFTNIDTFQINNATIFKTNLFSFDSEFKNYIIKKATIDTIGRAGTFFLEEIKIFPKANEANFACGIEYDYDRNNLGIKMPPAPVRKVLVNTIFASGDNTTFFPYTSSSPNAPNNVFSDDYEGWRVRFSGTANVKHYYNGKLHSNYTNIEQNYIESVSRNLMYLVGRHEFQIENDIGVFQLRADVYSGALVVRDRAYLAIPYFGDIFYQYIYFRCRVRYYGNVMLLHFFVSNFNEWYFVYLTNDNKIYVEIIRNLLNGFDTVLRTLEINIPRKRNTPFTLQMAFDTFNPNVYSCIIDNEVCSVSSTADRSYLLITAGLYQKLGFIFEQGSFIAVDYFKLSNVSHDTSQEYPFIDINFERIYQASSNMNDPNTTHNGEYKMLAKNNNDDNFSFVTSVSPKIGFVKNDTLNNNQIV
jgi:hypothetical protein